MHIKEISLNGFKTYRNTKVELGPRSNIVGEVNLWETRAPTTLYPAVSLTLVPPSTPSGSQRLG